MMTLTVARMLTPSQTMFRARIERSRERYCERNNSWNRRTGGVARTHQSPRTPPLLQNTRRGGTQRVEPTSFIGVCAVVSTRLLEVE